MYGVSKGSYETCQCQWIMGLGIFQAQNNVSCDFIISTSIREMTDLPTTLLLPPSTHTHTHTHLHHHTDTPSPFRGTLAVTHIRHGVTVKACPHTSGCVLRHGPSHIAWRMHLDRDQLWVYMGERAADDWSTVHTLSHVHSSTLPPTLLLFFSPFLPYPLLSFFLSFFCPFSIILSSSPFSFFLLLSGLSFVISFLSFLSPCFLFLLCFISDFFFFCLSLSLCHSFPSLSFPPLLSSCLYLPSSSGCSSCTRRPSARCTLSCAATTPTRATPTRRCAPTWPSSTCHSSPSSWRRWACCTTSPVSRRADVAAPSALSGYPTNPIQSRDDRGMGVQSRW